MGLNAPNAEVQSPQQLITVINQLQNIKRLLSAPITALVGDSSEIKNIFEQIESQLPEPLQIKLWPASNLLFSVVFYSLLPGRMEGCWLARA